MNDHLHPGIGNLALRVTIVALALGTAYIHSTLGAARFTLNAVGYVLGAAAMIAPFAVARRHRWLIRIALALYAAITILAWAIEPALYTTAYVAKGIEAALIALLTIDFVRHDGNPIDRICDELRSVFGRADRPAAGRP